MTYPFSRGSSTTSLSDPRKRFLSAYQKKDLLSFKSFTTNRSQSSRTLYNFEGRNFIMIQEEEHLSDIEKLSELCLSKKEEEEEENQINTNRIGLSSSNPCEDESQQDTNSQSLILEQKSNEKCIFSQNQLQEEESEDKKQEIHQSGEEQSAVTLPGDIVCLVDTKRTECECIVPCKNVLTQLKNIILNPNDDPPQILVTARSATILPGPGKILPWLWLGDRYHSQDDILLSRKKVSLIINCTKECSNHFPEQFTYYQFLLNDSLEEDISIHFGDAFVQMEKARKNGEGVLVHCNAGVSRSATIILAYLMMYKRWSLVESYKHVMSQRQIKPNIRFGRALIQLEISLFSKSSMEVSEDPFTGRLTFQPILEYPKK